MLRRAAYVIKPKDRRDDGEKIRTGIPITLAAKEVREIRPEAVLVGIRNHQRDPRKSRWCKCGGV